MKTYHIQIAEISPHDGNFQAELWPESYEMLDVSVNSEDERIQYRYKDIAISEEDALYMLIKYPDVILTEEEGIHVFLLNHIYNTADMVDIIEEVKYAK